MQNIARSSQCSQEGLLFRDWRIAAVRQFWAVDVKLLGLQLYQHHQLLNHELLDTNPKPKSNPKP